MTDSDDETKPPIEELPEIIGGAAGAAFGLVVAGPAGAIAGGALGPGVAAALRYGADALNARRRRAGRAMQLAADDLGITADDLGQRATADPIRLELLARVLEAAGRTPFEQHVRALGRVLAAGVTDGALVDDALLIADAIAALTPPQVQLLHQLWGEDDSSDPDRSANTGGQRVGVISAQLPGHADLLPSLLEWLRGRGLVEDVGTAKQVSSLSSGIRSIGSDPQLWRLTGLGQRTVQFLRGA